MRAECSKATTAPVHDACLTCSAVHARVRYVADISVLADCRDAVALLLLPVVIGVDAKLLAILHQEVVSNTGTLKSRHVLYVDSTILDQCMPRSVVDCNVDVKTVPAT